jgi:unsaturated chondroitin disaccharide hydrolase
MTFFLLGGRGFAPAAHWAPRRRKIHRVVAHSSVRRCRRLVAAAAASALVVPGAAAAQGPPASAEEALRFAGFQIERTAAQLPPERYPLNTNATGAWEHRSSGNWGSGFFPGSMWLLYQHTFDPAWKARAEHWQAPIERHKLNTSTHDVGFMIYSSYGNAYRLTGENAYRDVVLTAAKSLASRYSPTVGSIRSWNTQTGFRVIVDNMVNLELLFWAARHGGDPAWRDMALSHALRTRENHVRPDGSTVQIVDYDEVTGAVIGKTTKQGLNGDSTWSRGQGWAIHGFTTAYRETGDPRLLDTARRTADWFIAHVPADGVPAWDFAATAPDEPRDSSAAAVAASGLLELGRRDPNRGRAQRYLHAGRAILASLTSSAYLARGTASSAVLLHGTYTKPGGNFDTGLTWGDYYLLEALLRRGAETRLRGRATGPAQVELEWTAALESFGVTGYEIERDGEPLAITGPVTRYVDNAARPGGLVRHRYTVRPLADVGASLPWSNPVVVATSP